MPETIHLFHHWWFILSFVLSALLLLVSVCSICCAVKLSCRKKNPESDPLLQLSDTFKVSPSAVDNDIKMAFPPVKKESKMHRLYLCWTMCVPITYIIWFIVTVVLYFSDSKHWGRDESWMTIAMLGAGILFLMVSWVTFIFVLPSCDPKYPPLTIETDDEKESPA